MDINTKANNTQTQKISKFPPVVSVLGHVDHGKTSLLDSIRKTDIAGSEHGGITQRIGISEIQVHHIDNQNTTEKGSRTITFIDTPGHAAFSEMRSQGVNAADIALLVIAADDGIKPQTKEAIEKIKAAKIPFIVVFTKIDLETAQIEKVKQMVMGEGILLEGFGGETPWIGVSSKTGENIKDLLDLILLVYDMLNISKDATKDFLGVVIDSKLDKKRGSVSTVIVKEGTITSFLKLFRKEEEIGRIRALFDDKGKMVKEAVPGKGVEVLGLIRVLPIGSVVSNFPIKEEKIVEEIKTPGKFNLKTLFNVNEGESKEEVAVIIKTETSGEMDAIKNSLPKGVKIIGLGQGDINQADILLAKDFKALVLGFRIGITKEAKSLADSEHVFYRTYTIIYKLLDELEEAITLLMQEEEVKIRGRAEIIAEFESNTGKILGVRVLEGRLAINDSIIITRHDKEIGNGKIARLKRGKAEVKQVAKGLECGVTIAPQVDFIIGDMLLSCSDKKKLNN